MSKVPPSPSTTASRCRSSASASGRCRTTRRSSAVGHGPGGRVPQHRHRGDLRQRRGHRQGASPPPASPARSSSSPPSCGTADQGYDATLRAFDASLAKLGLDYVDLYLIHWPLPVPRTRTSTRTRPSRRSTRTAARKAIGVSNFLPEHLERLIDETSVVPAVNQIELHPQFQQAAVPRLPRRARHRHRGLVAARPGQGPPGGPDVVGARRASTAGRPPRSCCAGTSSSGNVAIPKSVTPSRIAREHRRLRLRAGRRRTSPRSRGLDTGNAPRPGPGHLRRGLIRSPFIGAARLIRAAPRCTRVAGSADGGECGG